METEDDQEKQTYSKALIKRLKRTIKPAREKILKEDDINPTTILMNKITWYF